MVTRLLLIYLVLFNISVLNVLGNQLSTIPTLYFIINIINLKFLQTSVCLTPIKYVSFTRKSIYRKTKTEQSRKGRLFNCIFILAIFLNCNNFKKATIKHFRFSRQWIVTVNIYYLKLTQFNKERDYSL